MEPSSKKLLDRVRDAIRLKHYSIRTEQSYVNWIKRYIFFHNVRHPDQMGAAEVEAFLTHLAVNENVAASACAARFPSSHQAQASIVPSPKQSLFAPGDVSGYNVLASRFQKRRDEI